jgi:hypothetical protein
MVNIHILQRIIPTLSWCLENIIRCYGNNTIILSSLKSKYNHMFVMYVCYWNITCYHHSLGNLTGYNQNVTAFSVSYDRLGNIV